MARRTLMAVFAHPDDESFGVGGTLARYAAEGCAVYLVTATRGEAGEITVPDLATPAGLPALREAELRCACNALGIHPPIFLDYQDGQLAVVHQGQAVAKLVDLIRRFRPDVLLTFGPDGVYGHYDHIAVHRWTTIAYDLAADPDCFPGKLASNCRPHQVSKLYYHELPASVVPLVFGDARPSVSMDGVPFPVVGVPDAQLDARIDISAFVEAKWRAVACHVSQVGLEGPAWADEETLNAAWSREETFVLARSTAGRPTDVEGDLFARLA